MSKIVNPRYLIQVANEEGDTSSYSSADLMEVFQWALNWAGIHFELLVEGGIEK